MNVYLWGFVILSTITSAYILYLMWTGMKIAEKNHDEGGHS